MFLPISKQNMTERGWDQADFVLVTGDAYVDHPSFGTAIISRVLESRGYRVAILAQPDWHGPEDFRRFGRPRLGFLINSGNVDSMVNNFSVSKNR
ncbi:MAG: YgiQ family radical SAM protein, partial [Firmicutes bacterium]|nr:YgiQ family radical SAM protein [Bacillota bacterium]